MTEWDAAKYVRRSSLQESMAQEVLALLQVNGSERVLDIGCGDGRITAQIAARVPHGSVLGIDASHEMIAFASKRIAPNLQFQVANAANLHFHTEFDLIVSINALHWLPDPDPPLHGIRSAMKRHAVAQLRLVPDGPRKSLETVIEETRKSPRWAPYFDNFRDPYLHLTPEQYAQAAQRNGLRVTHMHTASQSWDFQSRENFFASCQVTLVEWTRRLPEQEKGNFINNVLDTYRTVAADIPTEANTFKFYQMDVTLSPTVSG
ncbi:MAG TPA: methyltransferase domain-containing protein [Candidatus Eremiobacteraceae bacterium]|nr:methyltransferase domain-containing protein [Candidatus Eremiobacteraceae bacterium]